jgi:hypothetical protein
VADFTQVPQGQSVLLLAGGSPQPILALGTGISTTLPSPEIIWPSLASPSTSVLNLPTSPFTSISQKNIGQIVIYDTLLAYLTYECPPIATYPLTGQRWPWSY